MTSQCGHVLWIGKPPFRDQYRGDGVEGGCPLCRIAILEAALRRVLKRGREAVIQAYEDCVHGGPGSENTLRALIGESLAARLEEVKA